MTVTIEFYEVKHRLRKRKTSWYWRATHQNGNILADGGQGYSELRKARQGFDALREALSEAEGAGFNVTITRL